MGRWALAGIKNGKAQIIAINIGPSAFKEIETVCRQAGFHSLKWSLTNAEGKTTSRNPVTPEPATSTTTDQTPSAPSAPVRRASGKGQGGAP